MTERRPERDERGALRLLRRSRTSVPRGCAQSRICELAGARLAGLGVCWNGRCPLGCRPSSLPWVERQRLFGLLASAQGWVGAEDECFAGRAGEHPEELLGGEAGLASGGRGDNDAVELFDSPESFECVDRCA